MHLPNKKEKKHDFCASFGRHWKKCNFQINDCSPFSLPHQSDTDTLQIHTKTKGGDRQSDISRTLSIATLFSIQTAAGRDSRAASSPPAHRLELHASKWERRGSGGVRSEREAKKLPTVTSTDPTSNTCTTRSRAVDFVKKIKK